MTRRWEDGCCVCTPDCCDEWLWMIWAIGYDYDGYHTVEGLQSLINEMVEMTVKARDCLWEDRLFGEHGAPANKTWRVPSKEEWIHQYGTNKQIAGYEKRKESQHVCSNEQNSLSAMQKVP